MNPPPDYQPGGAGGPSGPGGSPYPGFPLPAPAGGAPAGARQVTVRLPLQRVWLLYVLLGMITVVFIGQYVLAQANGGEDILSDLGEKDNALIAQGQYWRLLTAIFLHADILHYGFNAYALYIIGRDVERFSGSLRMGLIFFLTGLCASVFSLIFTPPPSIGASGAIFGLIGAEAVFFYRQRQILGQRATRMLQNIVIIVIINFALDFGGNIDIWAHLGGLIGGVILGFALGPTWAISRDPMQGGQPAIVDQQPMGGREWLLALAFGVAVAAMAVFGAQLYLPR